MGDETEDDAGGGVNAAYLITSTGAGVVNYYFPVTVEVRAVTVESGDASAADRALDQLADSLDSQ